MGRAGGVRGACGGRGGCGVVSGTSTDTRAHRHAARRPSPSPRAMQRTMHFSMYTVALSQNVARIGRIGVTSGNVPWIMAYACMSAVHAWRSRLRTISLWSAQLPLMGSRGYTARTSTDRTSQRGRTISFRGLCSMRSRRLIALLTLHDGSKKHDDVRASSLCLRSLDPLRSHSRSQHSASSSSLLPTMTLNSGKGRRDSPSCSVEDRDMRICARVDTPQTALCRQRTNGTVSDCCHFSGILRSLPPPQWAGGQATSSGRRRRPISTRRRRAASVITHVVRGQSWRTTWAARVVTGVRALGRLGAWALGRLGAWALGRLGAWALGRWSM